jgi:hypothetical protein
VPDDLNFFAASKMQEWFVSNLHTNELIEKFRDSKFKAVTASVSESTNSITTADAAKAYLVWSDKFKPDFDLIRSAVKRPYARINCDYSIPFTPLIDFIAVRGLAQVLAQRTHCYLILGQPENALAEITLLNDFGKVLGVKPPDNSVNLITGVVNVAIAGLYVNTIADGLRLNAWPEPQLIALQEQLKKINLAPIIAKSFEFESAAHCWAIKNLLKKYPNDPSLWQDLKHFRFPWMQWVPSGWVYQNMVTIAKLGDKQRVGFDFESGIILPNKMESSQVEIENALKHSSPYNVFVVMAGPHFFTGWQTTAHNQTLVNEAQIVCALEGYRLAHGEYPDTLAVLAPQFIETIPHDIIGGQPLHYRRTNDGKFLLYSVGWNEKDDGGSPGTLADVKNGDWVWK